MRVVHLSYLFNYVFYYINLYNCFSNVFAFYRIKRSYRTTCVGFPKYAFFIFKKSIKKPNLRFFIKIFFLKKQIALLNQKIYFFNFFEESNTCFFSNNYFFFYNYFAQNDVFILKNFKKNFMKTTIPGVLPLVDLKKKLIYKIRGARGAFLFFFFFLKTIKQLTTFINSKKNTETTYFNYITRTSVYALLINLAICYNYNTFVNILDKNVIFINGIAISNRFYLLRPNDVISVYLTSINYVGFIKKVIAIKNIFLTNIFNHNNISLKKNFTYINLCFNICRNFEFFYPGFTFIYISLHADYGAYWRYFCENINITNIRSYNWLVTV